MNKQIIETELDNLFELLRCIVVEEQSRKKVINQNTVRFNRSIVKGFTQFFIFIIILIFVVKFLLQTSYKVTENSIGILSVILIFFLLGASLVSILIPLLVGVDVFYKESKESTHNLLKSIKKDNVFIHNSAKKISEFIGINIQTLEFVKTNFKLEIDIIQSKEKILDSLAPLLAILFAAFVLFFLGINIQDIKSPLIPAGVGAVTPLIFQFLYKRQLQDEIINLKKCIAIIEQAQALANNTESK